MAGEFVAATSKVGGVANPVKGDGHSSATELLAKTSIPNVRALSFCQPCDIDPQLPVRSTSEDYDIAATPTSANGAADHTDGVRDVVGKRRYLSKPEEYCRQL
ncbi:hypothetical protein PR003_g31374 [Phytophthora rubi]|uniref:Uncharacterized protein n=1 Tax=Phytophthora rubi TaxID=129364 RepID=A0A6A3GUW9_9STRA|nr:hypothetical protein PR001_g30519 [Phytophthora rubi]KAE8960672.1 hypothetical protein PR002_g30137 [Phytophthora rubi]KAE9268653.1 hypothetical protein PR003_g31374 [Phytophthora rubi]